MALSLKDREWKEFFIESLFTVFRGKRLIEKNRKKGNIPYYSASSSNNGLTDFISNPLFLSKNNIVITTFGDSYYIKNEFTASDEITILDNSNVNIYSAHFITRSIRMSKHKFMFGYKAFTERLKRQIILLPITPEGKPDYDFMEQYTREQETTKQAKYKAYITQRLEKLKSDCEVLPLKAKKWKEFFIEEVFNINSGVRLTKASMKRGTLPFIGASDSNNGITEFISNINKSLDSNVLGVNYNGSVVENFYHPYKAIFSDDVKRLSVKSKQGNKYLYLFAKTMILQQKSKYEYGYKFNGERMARQKIMLPINSNNEPDYEYMEQYMKALEYKKLKAYLDWKNKS